MEHTPPRLGPVASRRNVLALGAVLALLPGGTNAQAPDDSELLTRLLARGESPPPRSYSITRALELRSGQRVTLAPGTRIMQRRPNTPVFTAVRARDLMIAGNGAELWGEGSWSPTWTGNSGRYDQAIQLIGCQEVVVDGVTVRNCAHSGIAIIGGSNIRILRTRIEGTHCHGHPLPHKANFQMGIYVRHDPTYGAVDAITIEQPDISGTAQGIVSELGVAAPLPRVPLTISDAYIHDIPGQHAVYLQAGPARVLRPLMERVALAGVKVQAGDANTIVSDVIVTGAVARDLGSQMFEIAVAPPFTGKVRDIQLEGNGTRVARTIAIGRRVERLTARLTGEDLSDTGVELNGESLSNIDITADLRNVGQDGVVVYARSTRDVRIRATVRNANTSDGRTACGIRVESPSAEVTLIDPDVDDAAGRMHYGLFNAIAGSTVRIKGSARFTGAALHGVRATGMIKGLPRNAPLTGRRGGVADPTRIRFRTS